MGFRNRRGRRTAASLLTCLLIPAGTATAALLISPLAGAAGGTALYLSASGSDTGTCTNPANPCGSFLYTLSQVSNSGGNTIYVDGTIAEQVAVTTATSSPTDPLTIRQWPGRAQAAIDGQRTWVPLRTDSGTAVTIDGVDIQNGYSTSSGGGIDNSGTLTVNRSTLTFDEAFAADPNVDVVGGGIYNNGTLTVENSTFVESVTINSNGPAGGAAIFNNTGTATIKDSTITGDITTSGASGIQTGGGTTIIEATTFSGNQTPPGDGVVENVLGTVDLAGDIFAGVQAVQSEPGTAPGTECAVPAHYGTMTDLGYNISDDSSCSFSKASSTSGSTTLNASLGALAGNGGPTQTVLPTAASPAADQIPAGTTAGTVTLCTGVDQRGISRPSGASKCAMGATETTPGSLPTITSAPTATFAPGSAGTFTFTTSGGLPSPPALTESGALPSGVTFVDNGDGTATLSGTPVIGTSGTFALKVTADNGVGSGVTQSFSLSTAISTTTTAAPASATQSSQDQTVNFNATVTSSGSAIDGGTVTFTVKSGATVIGTPVTSGTVAGGAATASYTLPGGTPAANYIIQAVYNPASGYASSSDSSQVLAVDQVSSSTTVSAASATFSGTAQSLTLSATVSSPSGPVNEGTVTFTVKSGATVIGTPVTSGTVAAGSATASYTLPGGTPAANYTIDAVFGPTPRISSSSGISQLVVTNLADTTTTAAPASATFSATVQSVALSATVSSSIAVTSGTVTFSLKQGATVVGSPVTSGTVSSGSAAVTYALPAGTVAGIYTIDAVYNPGAAYAGSSDTTHQLTVDTGATITAASPSSATYSPTAQSISLSATVRSSSGTVDEGTITFTVKDGSTAVGTPVTSATVSGGSATVSYPLPAGTPAGTLELDAAYNPGADFAGSSDATQRLAIAAADQTIAFTTTPPTAPEVGGTYAVAATATSGLPVAFSLDATSEGCTLAGPVVTLVAAGTCVVDATQAGTGDWNSAPPVPQSFTVGASRSGGGAAAATPDGTGYWIVHADGGVFAYGDAHFLGSMGGQDLNAPIVGIAAMPDGQGYWLVASDGGVFAYGDAHFLGSMGGQHLDQPIVGIASTPDGKGYWLVASDGGVFAFGDAHFLGSMGGQHLNQPIVGIGSTPDGMGYWLVASDGGVFAFGDAGFHGSTGSTPLFRPIVGITSTPDGQGYWLVAADGGVFAFGDAGFHGSDGGHSSSQPFLGLMVSPLGGSYTLIQADGTATKFGS